MFLVKDTVVSCSLSTTPQWARSFCLQGLLSKQWLPQMPPFQVNFHKSPGKPLFSSPRFLPGSNVNHDRVDMALVWFIIFTEFDQSLLQNKSSVLLRSSQMCRLNLTLFIALNFFPVIPHFCLSTTPYLSLLTPSETFLQVKIARTSAC